VSLVRFRLWAPPIATGIPMDRTVTEATATAHDHHHDLNLRIAAYLHVIADAATSVLAIVGTAGWLDFTVGHGWTL
jgi:hypothetical protein